MGTRDRRTSRRIAAHFGPYLDLPLRRAGTTLCGLCCRQLDTESDASRSLSVVYTRLSGHRQVVSCALGSFGAFLLSLYFLQKSGFSFWPSWITGFLAISLGLMLTPNKVPAKFQIHYPRWDLPARVFSATAMVLTITLSASVLGSQWSGLLSPIPVLAWPLCVFVHHQQGSDGARAVLRGILEGAYGVLVFYTIVAEGLSHLSPILVYIAAMVASLIVSVPWLKSKLVLPAE